MQNEIIKGVTLASEIEIEAYKKLSQALRNTPIPDDEILANLNLFFGRSALSRTLFMNEIYQSIVNHHGVIMEFGVRWGQNLALLTSLRNIYEPYNITRKIIGFDTFEGFPHVHDKDGCARTVSTGALGVSKSYEKVLSEILLAQESLGPRPNVCKHRLINGDVVDTLPEYLQQHPETIISLAYFDFDLYEPTLKSLKAIKPYLTKGSIVAFDELISEEFPGETIALREAWGCDSFEIVRMPISPYQSYIVVS